MTAIGYGGEYEHDVHLVAPEKLPFES